MSIFRVLLKKKTTKQTIIRTFISPHSETMKQMVKKDFPEYDFEKTLSMRSEPHEILARKKRQII